MKRTPLHEVHKNLNAKFTEFGGWEMPIQYSSIVAEHLAVRSIVGLFDLSHMGEIEVSGQGANELVQKLSHEQCESFKRWACVVYPILQ